MFRDTLLESAPVGPRRKRWPMALAFTLEVLAGAVLIVLPLLSTGIIPVSARVPLIAPQFQPVAIKPADAVHGQGDPVPDGAGRSPSPSVIPLAFGPNRIKPGALTQESDRGEPVNFNPGGGPGSGLPTCDPCITPEIPKPPTRVRMSTMEPGMLIYRVEPQYPKMALIIKLHGDVKLHAVIAKDGSIQSLIVISGHPMLAQAAVDAVKQWRYRPYILNGQTVEVDTFVTVNFNQGK
jgi:periplasmic protein TonB